MGFCWPCATLTGGIYFAASTHICIGLFMTGYLAFTMIQISLAYGVVVQANYTFLTILMIYAMTFLMLGCLIFRGVEKKSVRILKPTVIIFGLIHALIFIRVVYVIITKLIMGAAGSLTEPSSSSSSSYSDTFGITFFTFLFFGTVIYLCLLAIHIRNLDDSYSQQNIFSQVQLGNGNGDGNPLYAYNTVLCHP